MLPSTYFLTIVCTTIFSIASAGIVKRSSGPLVRTPTFAVEGTVIPINQSANSLPSDIANSDAFFGVPFAQSPVGELRLEKPLPVLPYSEVLNVTSPYNNLPCYGQHSIEGLPYTEDCLKLNIFRPHGTIASDSLPVLGYLHPGGYVSGGAIFEAPQLNMGLLNNYVSRGIIVVQIQYRLAVLGFGSDGTSQLPGNLGLFDQQLALKWIHENIAAFGGNRSQITLYGTSAGSASVGYHSIHPNSTHFFQQAIQASGSFNSPWAEPSNMSVTSTLALAREVGCTEPARFKACLKGTSVESLQNAMNAIPYAAADFCFDHWAPTPDGDFLPHGVSFASMLSSAPPKRTMAGFNSDESITWTMKFPDSVFNIVSDWTVTEPLNFTGADLARFINSNIVPSDALNKAARSQIGGIRKALTQFYLGDATTASNATRNRAFYFQQYTRLLTDIEFIIPTLWEARIKAQSKWPVYLYHFDHVDASLAATLPYRAVQHASEYPYSIGPSVFGKFSFDADDHEVQKIFLGTLVNFITRGVPSSAWPTLAYDGKMACAQSISSYKAMNINTDPHLEEGSATTTNVSRRLAFWDALSVEFDLSLVRGFPNTMGKCVPAKKVM